jgi:hypothetical protein
MAIRDRVTVKTKEGTVNGLVVTKQGGTIEAEPPKAKEPNWNFEILNKEGESTGERLVVPGSEIVYIYFDKEPKKK